MDSPPSYAAADERNVSERTKFIRAQLASMTDDQLTRFEFFVRSHFPRRAMKDVIAQSLNAKSHKEVSDEIAISVAGLTKLYIGELIETATEVLKEEEGSAVGLLECHIIEAHRRMRRDGKIGRHSDPMLVASKGVFVCEDSWVDVPDREAASDPEVMLWDEFECMEQVLNSNKVVKGGEDDDRAVSVDDHMDES